MSRHLPAATRRARRPGRRAAARPHAATRPQAALTARRPALVVLAGVGYGVYYCADLRPLRDHRQRLRAGQRRADHAAGRRHRASRSRPTTPTSSRPASRSSSSTRPTRSVALDQAEAQLAQTVREVRTLYANNATLQAQIARARPTSRARRPTSRGRRTTSTAARRCSPSGAVGKEEFNHAERAARRRARARSPPRSRRSSPRASSWRRNQTLTDGTSVEQHPNVQRAAAARARGLPRAAAHRAAGAGRRLRRQAQRAGRPARRRPARR